MKMLWFVLINLLLHVGCRRSPRVPHRDASTTQGWVRGYLVQSDLYAYMGIPYAQTSKHNRFKAPNAPRRWDSIFEATHRITCPQSNGSGDENCLTINVFTPVDGILLPVLVYVHGGDFQNGWGPTEPMNLLFQKNVIIVTFNYRLGSVGFLCLRVPEAPGNAGLKDQVAALYWIHQNIFNFGGNPVDVTVYGIESGAISIQLLLLSRLAEGLFQKVILEAGSILSPTSMNYNPVAVAFNAAKTLGYDGEENGQQLSKFFLKLPLRELLNTTEYFLPCIETASYYSYSLVDSDPYEMLEQGNFPNLPMMIVYADKKLFGKINILDSIPEKFENLLPSNLEFSDNGIKTKVAELVKSYYFGESEDYKKSFADYMDDVIIHYPIVKMAALFAVKSSQPVFLMKIAHVTDLATCNSKDDCAYTIADLLNTSMDKYNWIREILSNFIKLGDPTPLVTASIPVIWQQIKTPFNERINMNYIPQLIINKSIKLENAATQKLLFWNHIYNKFYKVYNNLKNDHA